MKINGKSRTPIITAQSKTTGQGPDPEPGTSGGKKARASRTAKSKANGVKLSVLERISDGILSLDAGLSYTYLNERAGELLGCEAGQLIGQSLWEAHPEANGAPFAEACRRALETQTIVLLDGYFPASDRWLEGRVYPSPDGVSVLFSEGTQPEGKEDRQEERYRILFDTMQEGFLLGEVLRDGVGEDVDALLLEVNASMARFFGKSREELVGRTVREVFDLDEEDLDILKQACRVAMGAEDSAFIEKQDPATNRWLRAHIFRPKLGQFASLMTDITEEKEAEASIRDISKFPGENPNPVLRFTRDGQILYANQASASLLRAWEEQEEHTTPLTEIRELLPTVLEEGLNTEIEVINSGTVYIGLLVPVRDQGYLNLYLRDITERKQMEESLSAHIHQTNAGITRTDPEGRFTFVNQAFCEMLGYSEHDLIGKSIWEISHPDDVHKNKRLFERMLRDGESFQLDKRLLRRNGSVLWINAGTSPLRDATGRIHAATSIIIDITRRKRAEESLLDSARRRLYLASLSDTIRALSDPLSIQTGTAGILSAHLKASRVSYFQFEMDGTISARDHLLEAFKDFPGIFHLSALLSADMLQAFRSGRTVIISDVQNDTRLSETQKAAYETMVVRALILVPLIRNGAPVAALYVQQLHPREWKTDEISLVEETGERMQAAIERASAERKLRESQERLETAQKAGNVGVWDWDAATDKTYWSETMWTIHGYQQPKTGKIWESSQHPEDQPRVLEKIAQVLASSDTEYRDEYRIIRPDGSVRWIESVARVIRDETGKPVRMSGVNIDITERKQMETAIRESEERFRALVSQATAGIAESDLNGRLTFVNPTFCKMLGYSEQELLGKTVFELTYSEDVEENRQLFERMLNRSEPYQFEKRYIRKDGSLLWTDVSVTTVYDLEGRPKGGVGVVLDIENRKQAEEALRSSEERMRLAIEANRMVTWAWDPQADLITSSENFAEVYGLTSLSRKAEGFALVWPEDLPAHREKVERITTQGGEYQSEFRITRPADGRVVWMEERAAALIDDEGRVTRLVGVVTDVTERKRADQDLAEFARQQGALYQLAERLNRTESLDQVFDPALDAILNALQCDRASILLYDDANVMRFVAWRGLSDAYRQATEGHSPWTPEAKDPNPIAMSDISTADLDESLSAIIQQEGIRALAFIPLVANEKLIGKFMVYFDAPHTFENDELEFSLTIARQLASSVERKRAEESLRLSEHKFSRLFHFAPFAVALQKLPDARFTEVNGEFIKLFGFSRDELIGRTILDIGLPIDPLEYEHAIQQYKQHGSIRDAQFQIRTKSGRILWITANADVVEIAGEKFVLSVSEDITERKRIEEALRASEQRFREIFETAGVSVWLEDFSEVKAAIEELRSQGVRDFRSYFAEHPDFVRRAIAMVRILDVNHETLVLYGAQSKEELYRSLAEVFTPETESVFVQELVALAEGHEMLRAETQAKTLDGQPIAVLFSIHFNPQADDYSRVVVTVTDITARKQAEEALRQSEERFTQFMQHLPGLAWIKDIHGRYIYANAFAERVFRTSPESLYGKTDDEIFPPETAAQFRLNDEQALKDEKGVQVVETLEHEDGIQHFSLVTKFPIPGPDDRPALIGGTAFDITERIQMEEALDLARESAEETANRMTRLQKVTAALSEAQTPFQVAQIVVDQGAPAMDAVSGSMMILDEDNQTLETVYTAAAESIIRPYRSFPLSLNVPAADAVRSGQPVWIESQFEYMERYPHLAEQIDKWGHQAGMAIPMSYKGKTLGVLTMSFDRTMSSLDDREYALTLARQGSQALERARAENALRESEERYRAIISQATAGIVRKDSAGRLLFVNQAFCNMLDQTDAELLGKAMWELTYEEDVAENKRLFHRLMEEGTPFVLEKRLIRRDGSILWVTVSVSPVLDVTGKPHSAVSVYVDITHRKQAENRLALLARVSELAREFEEPGELLYAVSRAVGEHFQVRRALFNEIDVENDREVVHRDYCRGVESVAGVHTISEYSSVTSAEMMAGKTVVNRDSKLDPRTAADYEKTYAKQGERAYIAVPLMQDDRWVASLWISDDQPREWRKDDVYLLEAIAERTWTAAEKLRVDRALRDSEERLRVTFNTTAVGFATLTPDTRFVDVNDAFCSIVGYSREELLDMNFASLTHPQFLEDMNRSVRNLVAGQVPSFTLEKIYIRRDGSRIWVQNNVSLVRDAEGDPLHLIAICQDITERKRAEEDLRQLNLELEQRVLNRTAELQSAYEFLRESEATSRLILESMPDAIVITDRDGRIVHANAQVEALFGYSPNEVLGQPVEILLPERFRNRHVGNREIYAGQPTRRIMGLGLDLFGLRKDQGEIPVDIMLSPINNNTTWDVMVSIRDNTKQRQAQEALRTNEEKLRTLFEILPVGISFLGKDGNITEMNSALTDILGLSKSDLIKGAFKSRRYIRSDGSPMPPSEFASRRAILEQKTVYNVETGIVRENGNIIWTSVNAAPVKVADVEAAVVTIDVTQRKQAEEAIQKHRERLKTLSRRLVEVQEEERRAIARELHDRVGQNLAALTLNLNILRSQLSKEILETVGTRLNDSVNLVKDILTITRSVMADLRPNVLDDYGLDAALNEYADRFSQRTGIRVITRTPVMPTPRPDTGVEMTLLRIAQEALTNIARHSQASEAVISLELEKDAILMKIEDNGTGILSWQKVNQPGSHGLRIMRERAEAFGGHLKVNSAYKSGTTIEVKIPLASGNRNKGSQEKRS